MALAPSWDSVAAPGLRTPEFTLPARRWTPSIPVYPAGRHRGARRPWLVALLTAFVPTRQYAGRHREGSAGTAYNGRHRP
ncbi:MAG: hypothetical protein ABR500_04360 [Dermatophilaceae bacterium]|nr:hypothetical protein [Intrasporangiaceae bacterium]